MHGCALRARSCREAGATMLLLNFLLCWAVAVVVKNVVKLKHRSWHMIISYAVADTSATHTNDLHAFCVFLCHQFRFISAYSIEGLACTAVLRTIGFNGYIISDRWLSVACWTISPAGMYTNCIFMGYLFVTNVALWMCTLLRYALMWRIWK